MFDFLKTFGQGFLYLILSPFLIAFSLIYMVYAFFVFLFIFFKRIFMFFAGEDMKEESIIDRLAKIHLQNQDEKNKSSNDSLSPTPVMEKTTTIVQPIIIQTDQNGVLKSVQVPQNQNNSPLELENKKVIDNEEEEEEL